MALYRIYNGASPTTAALTPVTTGTSIKTLLQVQPSATKPLQVVGWGISFDGSAAATPIKVELIETDVAATVTAHVQAGIVALDGEALASGNVTTNLVQVGTANTGYTSSAEGSTTSARLFDYKLITPTAWMDYSWSLGTEPVVQVSKFLRIRVTAAAAVNAVCYIDVRI